MSENPPVAIDELYALGGLPGDANGDGYPDSLRARIVLADEPDAASWCALLNLAARLGLETAGFSPPLVVDEPGEDQLAIVVRRGEAAEPRIVPGGYGGREAVVAEGARAIEALARAGQADRGALGAAPEEPVRRLDLRDLFETSGLLADRDGDGAPDGTRLCVIVPSALPPPLGAALVDFCARLGMESGGIDFPLAMSGSPAAGSVPLAIELDPARQGGELAVAPGEVGAGLVLRGDPQSAAALVERLAHDWPAPVEGHLDAAEAVAWLRRGLAGWTAEGRAAALRAALLERGPLPEGAVVRLLAGDADEQRRLSAVARGAGGDLAVRGPGSSLTVFAEEWSARWEVERALEALRERLLPGLSPALPLELTVLVSEPAPVRARLREQVERLLAQAGFAPQRTRVVVLDAFKAGLSWLLEDVLPRLRALDGLERLVIRYRPLEPAPGEPAPLDLRIRWLQELFPADELLAGALGLPLERVALEEWEGEALYAVEAYDAEGRQITQETFSPLTERRPYLGMYPAAGTVHLVSGGLIARQPDRELREPLPTDLDLFWSYYQDELLPRVARFILESAGGEPRAVDQPFFDELRVDLSLSATDEPFGVREERRSAAEALHEDIYFNTLDLIETLGQEVSGERFAAPGAVLPFVHLRPGKAPAARITLRARPRAVAELELDGAVEPLGAIADQLPPEGAVTGIALDQAGTPHLRLAFDLDAAGQARLAALAALFPAGGAPSLNVIAGGEEFALAWPAAPEAPAAEPAERATPEGEIMNAERLGRQLARLAAAPEARYTPALEWSYGARPLPLLELTAPSAASLWSPRKLSLLKPTLMIVARHHANEVASTTAALLLAERLVRLPEWRWLLSRVNVVVLPLANPDGAALHDRLEQEHPSWKHHPARYNATGFEFAADIGNPDSRYGEARARDTVFRRWLPDIVVDNHGVPSHEWAQLYAGFGSPPRFGVSYWQVQALIYGIIHYLEEQPAHRQAAFALRNAVAEAVAADAELLAWNRRFRERYQTWGARRLPERFPAETHREMIFHFGPASGHRGRGGRNFAARFPQLTVADWVTEVADETVRGPMLRRTATAHLTANRATLDLLAAAATPPQRRILGSADTSASGARTRITLARRRPILLGG
ncbi:MAG TPA: M14 family metallopeptidase [Thermomicrobiaceae bacterium]|nr:M14 family metallopeptidase [Thermomicrobiaceae bacterium]